MGGQSATLTRAPAKQAKQPAKQTTEAAAAQQTASPRREFTALGATAVPKSFAGIPPLAPGEKNAGTSSVYPDRPAAERAWGIPAAVGRAIESEGKALDTGTRDRMQRRLGHDFGAVRIHSDGEAATAARSLRAAAVTSGTHILFAAGAYRPEKAEGEMLLAHELTHVVQQQRFGSTVRGRLLSRESDGAERQAEEMAAHVELGWGPMAWSPERPASVLSLAGEGWYERIAAILRRYLSKTGPAKPSAAPPSAAGAAERAQPRRGPFTILAEGSQGRGFEDVEMRYTSVMEPDPANPKVLKPTFDLEGLRASLNREGVTLLENPKLASAQIEIIHVTGPGGASFDRAVLSYNPEAKLYAMWHELNHFLDYRGGKLNPSFVINETDPGRFAELKQSSPLQLLRTAQAMPKTASGLPLAKRAADLFVAEIRNHLRDMEGLPKLKGTDAFENSEKAINDVYRARLRKLVETNDLVTLTPAEREELRAHIKSYIAEKFPDLPHAYESHFKGAKAFDFLESPAQPGPGGGGAGSAPDLPEKYQHLGPDVAPRGGERGVAGVEAALAEKAAQRGEEAAGRVSQDAAEAALRERATQAAVRAAEKDSAEVAGGALTATGLRAAERHAADLAIPVLGALFTIPDVIKGVRDIAHGNLVLGTMTIGVAAVDAGSQFLHFANEIAPGAASILAVTVQGWAAAMQTGLESARVHSRAEELRTYMKEHGNALPPRDELIDYYGLNDEDILLLETDLQKAHRATVTTEELAAQVRKMLGEIEAAAGKPLPPGVTPEEVQKQRMALGNLLVALEAQVEEERAKAKASAAARETKERRKRFRQAQKEQKRAADAPPPRPPMAAKPEDPFGVRQAAEPRTQQTGVFGPLQPEQVNVDPFGLTRPQAAPEPGLSEKKAELAWTYFEQKRERLLAGYAKLEAEHFPSDGVAKHQDRVARYVAGLDQAIELYKKNGVGWPGVQKMMELRDAADNSDRSKLMR